MSPDLITGIIAFLFTLMILSYLIGDNPMFRIAVYVFVGVSAGYVAMVAWWQVLWPDLVVPLLAGTPLQRGLLLVPLLLSLLLIFKAWPPLTRVGMPSMGLLVGTGAAVAIGGAVSGTLLPQVGATVAAFDVKRLASVELLIDAMLILAGVVTTLVYFHFGARTTAEGLVRRFGFIEVTAFVGSLFVAIALGVLFAGVYAAALTAMIERLHFLGTFFGFG